MAELLEYTLVVMASSLFIGGSVIVYNGYSSFESGLSLRASFDSISSLALKAAADGSASATMSLPSSTLACEGGVLSLSAGGASQSEAIPLACSFTVGVSAGSHLVAFRSDSSRLDLSVI